MPYYGAARLGDTVITGHMCDGTTTIATGSQTVFINGRAAARKFDNLSLHTIESPNGCVPHLGTQVLGGQLDVLVQGLPLARVFTEADGPAGRVSSGSETVAVFSPV
jgi:uncharacterized Zn-binding protein involved in type VI secretion